MTIDDITANRHGNDPFSNMANQSIDNDKQRIRSLILRYIYLCEQRGATCEEVEQALQLSHQTVSPRISELRAFGWVQTIDNESRRTSSGRKARVHRVPEHLIEEEN